MDNHSVPQPGSAGQPSAYGPPLFYWEFDEPRRSALQARALVDEGYLAAQLNYGVRMLGMPYPTDEVPDLDELPSADGDTERYSDVVAAVLQVAAWRGFDLDSILDEALQHVDATLSYSADAAAVRPIE